VDLGPISPVNSLVPNLPVTATSPQLRVNTRELGFGTYQIGLRVRDDSGNFSTTSASALVVIKRGETAVAVLRSPPVAFLKFPFLVSGAESFGRGDIPILSYNWQLVDEAGTVVRFQTKSPWVAIGGPQMNPNDPLPRDLKPGKYLLSLIVQDDTPIPSKPDEQPLLIVPREKPGRRPIALAQGLMDGNAVNEMPRGAKFDLDGSDSVKSATGAELVRYIWTWLPYRTTTLEHTPWLQVSVTSPRFRPEWELGEGLHRFRLVVVDAKEITSAPSDIVVRVNPN